MPTLSQQELAELEALKSTDKENFTTQEAIDYYTYLSNKGFDYADLALGVVQNNTAQGKIANAYAEAVANDDDITFSVGSQNWLDMQYELIQRDFTKRDQANGAELDWQAHNTNHEGAFATVNLDPEAWTPNVALTQIDEYDPAQADTLWNELITDDGPWGTILKDGGLLVFTADIAADQSWSEIYKDYAAQAKWLGNLAEAFVAIGATEAANLLPNLNVPNLETFLDDIFGSGNDVIPPAWITPILDGTLSPTRDPAGFIPAALTPFDDAKTVTSPLVLDLDGDGIELTTFNAATTTTFFDIDADGFAEQTAWVGADDGLLAIDINENGRIDDASELFGSATVDGFAILAELDSNGDLIIDANDAAWTDLLIWNDANGDAYSQSGELATLSTYNIVSIDLAGVSASTQTISGNPISHASTFKYANGTTDDIVDAWFVHDNVNTFSTTITTDEFDARAALLPNLRGYGKLQDLVFAMSADEDLLDLVIDFTANWTTDAFVPAALDSDVEDILFTWAGVDGVAAGSRGLYMDAQKLEFLEELFGEEWQGLYGVSNPGSGPTVDLNESWDIVFQAFRAQLFFQAGGNALFDSTTTYNAWSGEFEGDKDLVEDAINDLVSPSTEPGVDTSQYWIEVARFLDHVKGLSNLTGTEEGWLDTAIHTADNNLSWDDIEDYYIASLTDPSGNTYYGTSGDDTETGTVYDDTFSMDSGHDTVYGDIGNDEIHGGNGNDILNGEGGNDEIHGDDGDDVLSAGAGGDFVYGDDGDDTYIYTSGDDVYSEILSWSTDSDTIKLPQGISLNDLTMYAVDEENLLIQVGSLGTIEIVGQFTGPSNDYGIEEIEFYDTSTLDLTTMTAIDSYGTNGDDLILGVKSNGSYMDMNLYGLDGDDELRGFNGDDTLSGGIGNDILKGGGGNDVYIMGQGFDKIYESGGTDTIVIPEGYTPDDVSFLWLGTNHMTVMVTGLGQIWIENQFSNTNDQVEYIEYAETSTVVAMSTISVEQRGGDGNDSIIAISTGASGNNILNGMGGDDTLQGLTGNDTYVFSEGNDLAFEGGGTDTVLFWEGWNPEDVSIYRSKGNGSTWVDLMIEDQSGNTLLIDSHFNSASMTLEYVKFHDDTTWDILNMEIETRGTSAGEGIEGNETGIGDASADDTIYGFGGDDTLWGYSGDDTLYGGDDNDTLYGGDGIDTLDGGDGIDTLYGGSGDDTYVVSEGLDAVSETSGGTDTIQYGPGIDLENLTFTNTGSIDVTIVLNSGTDEIEVLGQRNGNSNYHVEKILFDSGFSVNFADYANWITAANGDGNANTIIGSASANTLNGNGGNDEMHGLAGNDTLSGNSGADMIHGGTGDDILYGGDGLDFLYGGAGQDIFMFEDGTAFNNVDEVRDFSTGDGDALDISDVLDGYYSYGVDDITDFVQITDNGTDSTLYIDQNGGADNFVAVASILGVTGLTDEAALETSGALITV